MKKAIVFLSVIGLVAAANAELLPITNPGFESGLTGWSENLLGPGSTITTTSDAYDGSLAALLRTDWHGGTGVKSELLQTIGGLSGDTSYDFELWVKGLKELGGYAWAEIYWLNDSDAFVGGSELILLSVGLSNTVYQPRGGTYVSPSGTTKATISIRLEGAALPAVNTLYVDAVIVPEPATLLLLGMGGVMIRKRNK